MEAIKDGVIIKKQAEPEKSQGGVIIVRDPQNQHGEAVFATVIAAGPLCTDVKPGMTVLTQHGVGINFDGPDGEEYHKLLEEELLATIE
jgi:co-chaperonin GroES (HSP10)